ncbi:hypothetical protein [Streptomyces sp. V3I7]|uniref:hypothetical protein n=1 Tax=Streptomyces sp. V3I7 TaxID=3042278 RepID=UPI00278BA0F0|nr:hypothetical protein [Streptomyces sp. V3I7]MDQ0988832.1 hypothetical protein [Streptomyces sp. V3I7]
MFQSIVRGSAAGAAGTTVLNAVSYADMAWRGRPASQAPAQTAEKITHDTGHPITGSASQQENRLSALGALAGITAGCGTGIAVALMYRAGVRMPWWLGGIVTGGLAMAAADLPMTLLGVTDPASWSGTDWASDVVPHLLYGLVVHGIVTTSEG